MPRAVMLVASVVLSALALASCATLRPKAEATHCPESRSQVCLTAQECSYDRARDCLVCECSSSQSPPTRPPDANVPTR